jgi:hypothetical protein
MRDPVVQKSFQASPTPAIVADVMRPPLTTVEQQGHVAAAYLMKHAGATALMVLDAETDQPIGIIAAAAGDPTMAGRTWVLLTEAPEGGWGLGGHANTNEELVSAARAQIAELSKNPAGT